MLEDRKRRIEPVHPDVDFTKPIDQEAIMSSEVGDSCFGRMWDMESKQCPLCADNEICGVMYHHVQKRLIKALQSGKKRPLDEIVFDAIHKEKLMMWLSTNNRSMPELAKQVKELSKCDDKQTVIDWCKSFIIDHPRLERGEDGTIRVIPLKKRTHG